MRALGTQEEKDKIKRAYEKRRKRQVIYFFGMLSSFVFAFLAALWNTLVAHPSAAFAPVNKIALMSWLGLGLFCFILSLTNWWCPACFKRYPASLNMKYCPYCGMELR